MHKRHGAQARPRHRGLWVRLEMKASATRVVVQFPPSRRLHSHGWHNGCACCEPATTGTPAPGPTVRYPHLEPCPNTSIAMSPRVSQCRKKRFRDGSH